MKYAMSLALAAFITFAGYAGLGGPLNIPAFHDGMAAPKTIAVVVARVPKTIAVVVVRPHAIASNVVSTR